MNIALIMAGGIGSRMGSDRAKQLLLLNGIPVLVHTIRSFLACTSINRIVVVCNSSWLLETRRVVMEYLGLSSIEFTIGGKTRQQSVLSGLSFIEGSAASSDIVLIHDAARPFISQRVIEENISAALKSGAACTGIPVFDTIAVGENNLISQVLDRSSLYAMQTPQTFKLGEILTAHRALTEQDAKLITDDVGVILKQGKKPTLVLGDKQGFKITTTADLRYAEFLEESNLQQKGDMA